MIIDSHQHFWKYNPVQHSWIDNEMAAIRRDYMPEDFQKIIQENNIEGCIAIQADQTLKETDFLLELASKYSFIKGVIGWVDFRAKTIDEKLEYYSKFPKIKGFRHVVQGESDPNFLLRSKFLEGIAKLEVYGFVYEILVYPPQLGSVLEFIKKFPNIKFIINHVAKPYIKDGFFDGWAVLMTEIAKYPNVYCKLSGMNTEADYKAWTLEQLVPYMEHVLNIFGTDRVIYGSDWPVCLVAGSYKETLEIVTNFIVSLSPTEQLAIIRENAIKFYNL